MHSLAKQRASRDLYPSESAAGGSLEERLNLRVPLVSRAFTLPLLKLARFLLLEGSLARRHDEWLDVGQRRALSCWLSAAT